MIAPLFGSITRPLLSPLVSGLRDELFGAFTPRSLFNDGSIGVLYDNNDLTTMFVDTAGTTPATVNGLVGLQLDKSQGVVLGAELWADQTPVIGNSGGSVGVYDQPTNTMTNTGTTVASYPRFQFNVGLTVGKWYYIEGALSGSISQVSGVRAASSGTSNNVHYSTSTGVFRGYVLAATTYIEFLTELNGAETLTIDAISVKELPGNHRYQATTGFKPVLRGTPTGAELFTAYGTPGAGWSVVGATGTATTASSALPTTTAATVGKFYRVTYTVTRSAGSVQLSFGGRTGVSRSAAGQYVEYFDNALNTNALTATGTGFTGTVRIDEVKDVSAGSVTAPYGLQYDGVDDFLQTASVNFSATDKMFVCAGVRKLSDAAAGILAELSATWNSNNGSFIIAAPSGSVSDYQFGSRGTLQNVVTRSGFSSPHTAVLTMRANIAGPTLDTKVNTAASTTSTSSQGTGNFGNYPIYFGRRGGTSIPYSGLDFGFVIVNKTLTAAQISSTERWMAQRTGVTL